MHLNIDLDHVHMELDYSIKFAVSESDLERINSNYILYEIIHEYTMKNFQLNENDYYLSVFEKYYPTYWTIIPYYWMPKWTSTNDPSARELVGYSE